MKNFKNLFLLFVVTLLLTSCVEIVSHKQKVIDKYLYYNPIHSRREYFFTLSDERNKILEIEVTVEVYNRHKINDSVYYQLEKERYYR
jgi:hypothetical protein